MSSRTKTDELLALLKSIDGIGGIKGSAIVARNGLLIASMLPRDIDERRFGAMSATMMGAIETAAATMSGGLLKRVTAELENTTVITIGAGKKAILVTSVDLNSNLGLVLIEIEEIASKIKAIVD